VAHFIHTVDLTAAELQQQPQEAVLGGLTVVAVVAVIALPEEMAVPGY
jgi:hypothetical protein